MTVPSGMTWPCAALLCTVLCAGPAAPAHAADEAAGNEAEAAAQTGRAKPETTPAAPRSPTLDRLLTPRGPLTAVPTRSQPGGKDRAAWETAFDRRRREVAELDARIEATRQELRDNAGSDWNYSPAGGGQGVDPETQKLRARLKRDRQSREAALDRLRELEVEASLAGVPDEWIRP